MNFWLSLYHLPTHCDKCGDMLLKYRLDTPKKSRCNVDTGEWEYSCWEVHLICSSRHWWNLGHFKGSYISYDQVHWERHFGGRIPERAFMKASVEYEKEFINIKPVPYSPSGCGHSDNSYHIHLPHGDWIG